MKFAVVTIFPEMLAAIRDYGITSRAVANGLISIEAFNPRDHATDRHRTVDDRPYGGGPGMVMMAEPLVASIAEAKQVTGQGAKVVYLSPQGQPFRQADAKRLSQEAGIVLVAGRYEGIDQRVIDSCVDEEISIGDFVVSGGELPAMLVVDAISRCLKGVLGHAESAEQDSFSNGLLDCPHYTRPVNFEGMDVPDVLLSGHHEAIRQWRLLQSLKQTRSLRPELFDRLNLTDEQQRLLGEFQQQREANSNRS